MPGFLKLLNNTFKNDFYDITNKCLIFYEINFLVNKFIIKHLIIFQ